MTVDSVASPGMPGPASSSSAWLLLAAGDDRQHGGNSGYDDAPSSYYQWDSTVPNHSALSVGDRVALWDKKTLLGASVIGLIEHGFQRKELFRCRRCGLAGIKARRRLKPRYHCYDCGFEFEEPRVEYRDVRTYRATYEVGWTDLRGILDGSTLRSCASSPKDQLSLRRLNWARFTSEIRNQMPYQNWSVLTAAQAMIDGTGTVRPTFQQPVVLRARVGYGDFRYHLLERYGSSCVISGPAPMAALEAVHLYRYSYTGSLELGTGLLLRRDVRSLLDAGLITAAQGRVRVHSGMQDFPAYQDLEGRRLATQVGTAEGRWLIEHEAQSRNMQTSAQVVATKE